MSSPFTKVSSLAGGSVFKPGDHMNDLALLLEPAEDGLRKDVENTYQGKTTVRDEVVTTVTVFKTQESLDKGEPDEILDGVRVVHGMLTDALKKVLGGVTVGVVRKVPTKAGSGYAFRDPEGDAVSKVAAYYEAREKAVAEVEIPEF